MCNNFHISLSSQESLYSKLYKCLIITILFSLSITTASSQSNTTKGIVIDTAKALPVANMVANVLHEKDSIWVAHTRTNAQGQFELKNLPQGNFILVLTHPSYPDLVRLFSLSGQQPMKDFGRINLIPTSQIIEEVVIKAKALAVRMKGDTTEFNAAAYQVAPNAKVEDLVKQFPGMRVDNQGKISYNGETISRVLVDGEEFFGDDPTLVTRNIRADMVDKVQMYDDKSDMNKLTGIDDGIRNKTLNVKLKEDKKSGYFGKIDVGGGTDKYYSAQGMFNLFNNKSKFSTYGNLANTGKVGLNFNDKQRTGTAGNVQFVSGGITISGQNFNDIETSTGSYNGRGLPEARTSGIHYDTKWNNNKNVLNTNYKVGELDLISKTSSNTLNNLPSGTIYNNQEQTSDSKVFRQLLDFSLQTAPDPSSTLKIAVDGLHKKVDASNSYIASTQRANGSYLNQGVRQMGDAGTQRALNGSAAYTRKLSKPRRSLAANFNISTNTSELEGYLNATNTFYSALNTVDSTGTILQQKNSLVDNTILTSSVTYTEPLSKDMSLILNYGIGYNSSAAVNDSYNVDANGNILNKDQEFSNDFLSKQFSNQTSFNVNYNAGKNTLTVGSRFALLNFDQLNRENQQRFKKDFFNLFPSVTYRYQPGPAQYANFRYTGGTQQPSITQLQPIRNNADPLNIVVGNNSLKPSFNHSLGANYTYYSSVKRLNLGLSVDYTITTNPIETDYFTNEAGISITNYVNLRDKTSGYFGVRANFGYPIKFIDGFFSFSGNYSNRSTYSLANKQLNNRVTDLYNLDIFISKSKANKYEAYVGIRPNYTDSRSSLPNQINNKGFGYNSYATLSITLPGKTVITTGFDHNFQAKNDAFGQDLESFILNFSIDKRFLAKETLRLNISGNDLLNQNRGFSRTAFNTSVVQSNYLTIQRYFMFSLIWDFNKMGGSK